MVPTDHAHPRSRSPLCQSSATELPESCLLPIFGTAAKQALAQKHNSNALNCPERAERAECVDRDHFDPMRPMIL